MKSRLGPDADTVIDGTPTGRCASIPGSMRAGAPAIAFPGHHGDRRAVTARRLDDRQVRVMREVRLGELVRGRQGDPQLHAVQQAGADGGGLLGMRDAAP